MCDNNKKRKLPDASSFSDSDSDDNHTVRKNVVVFPMTEAQLETRPENYEDFPKETPYLAYMYMRSAEEWFDRIDRIVVRTAQDDIDRIVGGYASMRWCNRPTSRSDNYGKDVSPYFELWTRKSKQCAPLPSPYRQILWSGALPPNPHFKDVDGGRGLFCGTVVMTFQQRLPKYEYGGDYDCAKLKHIKPMLKILRDDLARNPRTWRRQ